MYIDTHCHLDDEKYSDIDNMVKNSVDSGVKTLINTASNMSSSKMGKVLSERFREVYFTVGIHPDSVNELTEENILELENLSKNDKCVAVGEIGLDYHYLPFDKELQQKVFNRQIEMANKVNLPFSIHSRDSTLDTLNIVKGNKSMLTKSFILHCFSGSIETAREYLNLGGYISFGGTVTFRNAQNIKEVAKFVPLDRLLTETDSPYLSPEPKRGQVNSPENIPIICDYIANIKGIEVEKLKNSVYSNACNVFYRLNKTI